MKRILCLLTALGVCLPAAGQLPVKMMRGTAKALGSGAKQLPGSIRSGVGGLRYAPGVSLPPARGPVNPAWAAQRPLVDENTLQTTVAEQVMRQQQTPAQWVRRAVAEGKSSFGLIRAILAVSPKEEQLALLQNEFLTLTLQQQVPLVALQAERALQAYRLDLIKKKDILSRWKGVQDVRSLVQQGNPLLVQTGEALADMAGIGFYGTKKDVSLLLSVYEAAAQSAVEPVFFTAAARAFLQLKDYDALGQLMAVAPQGEAWGQMAAFIRHNRLPVALPEGKPEAVSPTDWEALLPPFCQASRLNRRQLDFSEQGTQKWLEMKPRFVKRLPARTPQAPAQAQAPQQTPQQTPQPATSLPKDIPVYIAPSLQAEQTPGAEAKSASYGFLKRSVQTGGGVIYSGFPVLHWLDKAKKWFSPAAQTPAAEPSAEGEYNPVVPVLKRTPRTGLVSKQYPSGLEDEESIIRDWLEYFRNGYFRPRDQVEAIEGMSAAKANNVMEYLYYMPLEEAEKVILNPIRETGRLPDFMYDDRLIAGTKRLPAGYYKNKFNENVKRFVELAEEDGSIYTHNVELKDLATSMADYSFKQGFRYTNDPQMTAGLRHNWKELVAEIRKPGLRADRDLINKLWRDPVKLANGTTVSLKEYFTQTRPTAFFKEGRMPEFFLNSNKWVAWENERRNLAAAEYINQRAPEHVSWLDRIQDWFVLGKTSSYLTLDQFGTIMASQYRKSFGAPVRTNEQDYTRGVILEDATPSSMTVKVNNFDKVGGVCQMSFSDGGYMGRVQPGYDGTSTVSRFDLIRFFKVPVVTFDFGTLKPHIITLESVPYLKDLKEPDLDQVRASTMVGDGLDPTRDLLGVREAEAALVKIPHLKATLYPRARLEGYDKAKPKYLDGGGLAGYLTLFTPDFYPVKKVRRLRFNGLKPYIETQYFIRREVAALAGLIHRDRLTFTEQVQDRIVPDKASPARPDDPQQ